MSKMLLQPNYCSCTGKTLTNS